MKWSLRILTTVITAKTDEVHLFRPAIYLLQLSDWNRCTDVGLSDIYDQYSSNRFHFDVIWYLLVCYKFIWVYNITGVYSVGVFPWKCPFRKRYLSKYLAIVSNPHQLVPGNWANPSCKRPFVPIGFVLLCLLLDMDVEIMLALLHRYSNLINFVR